MNNQEEVKSEADSPSLTGIIATPSNDILLDLEKSRENIINESCLTDEEKKTELVWIKFNHWKNKMTSFPTKKANNTLPT